MTAIMEKWALVGSTRPTARRTGRNRIAGLLPPTETWDDSTTLNSARVARAASWIDINPSASHGWIHPIARKELDALLMSAFSELTPEQVDLRSMVGFITFWAELFKVSPTIEKPFAIDSDGARGICMVWRQGRKMTPREPKVEMAWPDTKVDVPYIYYAAPDESGVREPINTDTLIDRLIWLKSKG